MAAAPVPRSLVLATDLDVLPPDRVLERRDDHLIVRSPGNPDHWEGNYLVFDEPPRAGDGTRWEAAFAAAFADTPAVRHRALFWDRSDGDPGAAVAELAGRGYTLEHDVGMIATPAELVDHPRANPVVEIRALDPDGDAELWAGAITVSLANHAAEDEQLTPPEDFERFLRARTAERRVLFSAGRGAWYVALDPDDGRVVAGCGIVVTDGRARYQAVDTAPTHRRRGIARRLVHDAAVHACAHHAIDELVIVADPDYHAAGIYRSLGFRDRERVVKALKPPPR